MWVYDWKPPKQFFLSFLILGGNDSPAMAHSGSSDRTSKNGESNEISAPYEVPQFPIEQIEKKLQIQRQLNTK